jgi:hypothetical protein
VVPAAVKLPAVAAFELGSCSFLCLSLQVPPAEGAVARPDPYGGRAARTSPRERTRQAQTNAIRESDEADRHGRQDQPHCHGLWEGREGEDDPDNETGESPRTLPSLVVSEVSDELVGFGPIEFLVKEPAVTEVLLSIWARHTQHRLPILLA